jgi:hypothetical protein
MPSRNTLAIALLLLLGPLSLAGKLMASGNYGQPAGASHASPADTLLRGEDLVRVTTRPIIDGEAYRLAIYRQREPENCAGLLYLMPMSTNAEASSLLSRASSPRVVDHFFVLGGELSERFPAWRFWMLSTSAQLQRVIGRPAPAPVVHGVATTDACLEARRMNWSKLRV